MGKISNLISSITVKKEDRESFIDNELVTMGKGETNESK